MYKLDNEKSKNLSKRIETSCYEFFNHTQVSNNTKDIEIEIVSLTRGSVIVTFDIKYKRVPSGEAMLLQHEIESGRFNNMPVELLEIYPSSLPIYPPAQVKAISFTTTSINVSWHAANMSTLQGSFYLYQVFYREIDSGNDWDNFGTRNTSLTLIDLKPGIWYEIRVLASNQGGNGVASSLIKIQTIEGPPYIKPPSCIRQVIDEKTSFFSWDPIPPSQVPGTLRGYEIKFRKYYGKIFEKEVADATMTQRTVNRFKAYTWYWVEIAGYTNAGYGPPELFVFKTPPGAPEVPPPNITVHDRYSVTEMFVTWDPIPKELENGYLLGYKLSYLAVQQGGLELIGENIIDVILDRFTFTYKIVGLESYTKYQIFIHGYSSYGDGPSFLVSGDTCKCPPIIYTNWYELPPYTMLELGVIDKAKGLFPELLRMVVKEICTDCSSNTPTILFDKTGNGRSAIKKSENEIVKYIDNNVHFSFPIFGKISLTRFQGDFPYISFIRSQGSVMLVYQPRIKSIGLVNILKAVASVWPVILISILLAVISGWILWFLEQNYPYTDIYQQSIYGAYEGFWLSFITMTTLGYRDYVPWSFRAKAYMIFWILSGLVVVSLFGGAVSSGMSVGSMDKEYKLYGSKHWFWCSNIRRNHQS